MGRLESVTQVSTLNRQDKQYTKPVPYPQTVQRLDKENEKILGKDKTTKKNYQSKERSVREE